MAAETDVSLEELRAICAFPIGTGWVCAHCSIVANRPKCPWCLSENLASLQRWLEGKEDA